MIPLQDFRRHLRSFEAEIRRRIDGVISRGHFIMGPELDEFEARFAAYNGSRFCIGTGNGTQAMELALRAGGVGAGDDVVTVANAGMYATCAILCAGANPVFTEARADIMNMAPASLRPLLEAGAKAVVATHLYGQACDIAEIAELCREHGALLVEDCAEAHGAQVGERKVGNFGAAGCFSFYPTKNLGACGDAGAITTNDPEFAARLKSLRQYGWESKYHAASTGGMNSRMDEMQAAALNTKLDKLDALNDRRREIISHYNSRLSGLAPRLPFTTDDSFVVHHYVLRSSVRGEVINGLRAEGVATDIHFPVPDHRQPALAERFRAVSLPVSEECCRTVFTVPSFPEMTDGEVETVAGALGRAYRP
jgi:aminotransferase EvaB